MILDFVPVPLLKCFYERAVGIYNAAIALKQNKISFLYLAERCTMLVKTLNEKVQTLDESELAKLHSLSSIEKLMVEIRDFVDDTSRKGLFMQMMSHKMIRFKIQMFDQTLSSMVQNLQLSLTEWKKEDPALKQALQEDYIQDVETFKNTCSDSQKTMDEVLDSIGVRNSELIDSMAVINKRLSTFDADMQSLLVQINEKLIVRSGGTQLKKQKSYSIDESDIEYNPKRIGAGSFGEVFVGKWGKRTVAIKRTILVVHSSQVRDSLEAEADKWSKLIHPNILTLWGACLNSDRPFLVMPFLKNGNAMDYLNRHADTSLSQRMSFIYDISFGMQYLHEKGLIHGDLKADNVLIDDNLQALVSDFGLSSFKNSTSTIKSTGAIRWIAPERYARSSKPNEASDVYAFGMTAYQIIYSKVPFYEESQEEIVKQWILDGEIPTMDGPEPDNVCAIIKACLVKAADERPTFKSLSQMCLTVSGSLPSEGTVEALPSINIPIPDRTCSNEIVYGKGETNYAQIASSSSTQMVASGGTMVNGDMGVMKPVKQPMHLPQKMISLGNIQVESIQAFPVMVEQVQVKPGTQVLQQTQQAQYQPPSPPLDHRISQYSNHQTQKPQYQLPGSPTNQHFSQHPAHQTQPPHYQPPGPQLDHRLSQPQPPMGTVYQFQPQPPVVYQPQPQPETFIMAPPVFGNHSQLITCMNCKQKGMTRVSSENGSCVYLSATACCLCLCLGCIPFWIDSLKDHQHYCQNCGAFAGVKKGSL